MRYDPDYRKDSAARSRDPLFEDTDVPLRVQTEADLLAEADWALLAWEDAGAETWRSPFWSSVPMLVGEPDPDPWPDPAPLLGLQAGAGARLEGLSSPTVGSSSRPNLATHGRRGTCGFLPIGRQTGVIKDVGAGAVWN